MWILCFQGRSPSPRPVGPTWQARVGDLGLRTAGPDQTVQQPDVERRDGGALGVSLDDDGGGIQSGSGSRSRSRSGRSANPYGPSAGVGKGGRAGGGGAVEISSTGRVAMGRAFDSIDQSRGHSRTSADLDPDREPDPLWRTCTRTHRHTLIYPPSHTHTHISGSGSLPHHQQSGSEHPQQLLLPRAPRLILGSSSEGQELGPETGERDADLLSGRGAARSGGLDLDLDPLSFITCTSSGGQLLSSDAAAAAAWGTPGPSPSPSLPAPSRETSALWVVSEQCSRAFVERRGDGVGEVVGEQVDGWVHVKNS